MYSFCGEWFMKVSRNKAVSAADWNVSNNNNNNVSGFTILVTHRRHNGFDTRSHHSFYLLSFINFTRRHTDADARLIDGHVRRAFRQVSCRPRSFCVFARCPREASRLQHSPLRHDVARCARANTAPLDDGGRHELDKSFKIFPQILG